MHRFSLKPLFAVVSAAGVASLLFCILYALFFLFSHPAQAGWLFF